jgi:hypothetical protein
MYIHNMYVHIYYITHNIYMYIYISCYISCAEILTDPPRLPYTGRKGGKGAQRRSETRPSQPNAEGEKFCQSPEGISRARGPQVGTLNPNLNPQNFQTSNLKSPGTEP